MSIAEGLGGIFEDPSLLNRANTWSQPQSLAGGLGIPGSAGNNPGQHFTSFASLGFNPGGNLGWYLTKAGIFFNVASGGGIYAQSSGSTSQIAGIRAYASFSTPTIVSGTIYQNTTYSYQTIDIPCYATTAGTAGTVAVAYGTSSTPSTIYTKYVSGSTSSTAQAVIHLRIPPQWYYEVTVSGVTLGTPTMIQE